MDRDLKRTTLTQALAAAGIAPGDTVYSHICLKDPQGSWEWATDAMRSAVGDRGTVIVPTYTFSFCRREMFDVQRTPSACGPWSSSTGFLEHFRTRPEAVRSTDPIHSVA